MNRKSYLLYLTYQLKTPGQFDQTHDLVLQSSQLEFVGSGLDHVVFSNQNVADQIVIFKRLPEDNSQTEQSTKIHAFNMMEQVYEEVMDRKFFAINKYRWPKTNMYLTQQTSQIDKFFIQIQNSLLQKLKDGNHSVPEVQNMRLDRTYRKVQISNNIFELDEYNIYVQFKPKSVMPDLFSERMLLNISQKVGKSVSQIKQILKNGTPVQKTRWFKKNMLKNKQSNGQKKSYKINQNPLNIFNLGPQNKQIPDFIHTKLLKKLPELDSSQSKLLNAAIFKQIHNHEGLLQDIHQIQSIYPYSPDYIDTVIDFNLFQNRKGNFSLVRMLQQKMRSILQQNVVKDLDNMYPYLLNCDCVSLEPHKLYSLGTKSEQQEEKVCDIILFLISLSWKDISLVYRSKFNGSQFLQPQIWVIDDYLKSLNKIEKNVKKDESLLKKYIISKIGDNDNQKQ